MNHRIGEQISQEANKPGVNRQAKGRKSHNSNQTLLTMTFYSASAKFRCPIIRCDNITS